MNIAKEGNGLEKYGGKTFLKSVFSDVSMVKMNKNKANYLAYVFVNPQISQILLESCAEKPVFARKEKETNRFLRKTERKTKERNN